MPLYADVCGSTLTYAEILTHKAKEEMSRSIFFRRITEVFLYFDEYTNILKDMYITRFNGRPVDREASAQAHSVPRVPTPPFIMLHHGYNCLTLQQQGRLSNSSASTKRARTRGSQQEFERTPFLRNHQHL